MSTDSNGRYELLYILGDEKLAQVKDTFLYVLTYAGGTDARTYSYILWLPFGPASELIKKEPCANLSCRVSAVLGGVSLGFEPQRYPPENTPKTEQIS